MTIKALSLTQPWAQLVTLGAKRIETRSWSTRYRGWVAIHAAQGFPADAVRTCYGELFYAALEKGGVVPFTWLAQDELRQTLPRGAIIAVGNLHHVGKIGRRADGVTCIEGKDWAVTSEQELAFGDYTPGRYAWVLSNVGALPEPTPCKGALGLWTPPPEITERLLAFAEGRRAA